MASAFDNFLNKYGLGFRSFEQGMRQGDKRLAEQFKIPYDPLATIEERGVDPEAFRRLRESRMPQPPVPPTARPASPPPTQLIPDEGLMGRPLDMMPLVERPDLPSYQTAADLPVPTRPDMSMPRRDNRPPPGAGMFSPPTGMPEVPRPTIDSTIENLLSRYDGLYGEPPVAPEPRMPKRQDLGLPAFTTPGYFPEGMMSPRVERPNMQSPAMQNYQPDMFTGRLPMPAMPEYDYGSLNPQTAPDFSRMTEEEIDAYYSNILGY